MPLQENVFAKKSFGLYKKTLKMFLQENFENVFITKIWKRFYKRTLKALYKKTLKMSSLQSFENAFTRELWKRFTRELWKCLRYKDLKMFLQENFENVFTREIWKCLCYKALKMSSRKASWRRHEGIIKAS